MHTVPDSASDVPEETPRFLWASVERKKLPVLDGTVLSVTVA
jgi:hypothetical protein